MVIKEEERRGPRPSWEGFGKGSVQGVLLSKYKLCMIFRVTHSHR